MAECTDRPYNDVDQPPNYSNYQQTRDVNTVLVQCCASFDNVGPKFDV